MPRTTESGNNTKEKLQGQYTHILCNVSCGVSGITFKDIDKKWLHDNVYKYTTCLKTKALNLYVELTVKLEVYNTKYYYFYNKIHCFDVLFFCFILG